MKRNTQFTTKPHHIQAHNRINIPTNFTHSKLAGCPSYPWSLSSFLGYNKHSPSLGSGHHSARGHYPYSRDITIKSFTQVQYP